MTHDPTYHAAPLTEDGAGGWVVTGHAEVCRILADHDTFSSRVSRHLAVPNGMDPPEHSRYRALIEPHFSAARMAELAPRCQAICDDLVGTLAHGDAIEAMAGLADPFALRLQCAFLGWNDSRHTPLQDWIQQKNAAVASGDPQALEAVAHSFDTTIRTILAERRSRSGAFPDDITTALLHSTLDGQPLDDAVLVSILRNWTVGELGTIAASAGILLHWLATHPDLQSALRRQPEDITAANDEILRIHAPLPSNRRITTRACTLAGIDLPAGARLTLMWGAANRDASVFDAPLECRPARSPAANLLYGAGIHACPGAGMSRMALDTLIRTTLARTRHIEPARAIETQPASSPASGFALLGLHLHPLSPEKSA